VHGGPGGELGSGTRLAVFPESSSTRSISLITLLDLGAVLSARPDAAKEALRALDALVPLPLTPWRTVVVASGGVPERPHDFREGTWCEVPRPDWDTWIEIHHSGRTYLPLLRYGDYGVLPAGYAARTPPSGNGGPPWGILV
jgi:hypothetical protein